MQYIFSLLLTTIYLPSLQDEGVKKTAQLMYQTALMESGFLLSDPKHFASNIYDSVKSSLNISPDAAVEEEDEAEEAEAEAEAEAESKEASTSKGDDAAADADTLKDEL